LIRRAIAPDRWERLQEIFHSALELPKEAREPFVERACDGDADAVAEVVSLIKASETAGVVADIADDAPDENPSVDWIESYRLLGVLGRGGMSTVYLAEREGVGFKQRVALKLLRAGVADRQLADRLVSEIHILARLEHPGIARLIDGGATPLGQPYFAMELVEGTYLTEYCERKQLSLSDRLRIFAEICEAVHFAHQQLVVHRDLKPSNILVSEEGHPKLLDFGIAKLLDPSQELEGATATLPCFTPAYASPEQVRRGHAGTASDIYSLGVILYELLTGRRPYSTERASPAAIERTVCEAVPERPSALTADTRLRRVLAGDLDTIVMKALAKDPTRRYESVARFADDVRRYLEGRPVLARRDSLTYRWSKFVRRHRSGVAAAALVVASMAAGTLTAAWQARRAGEQRDLAAEEAAKAELATDLMVELFRLSDPTAVHGDTVSTREFLERGLERVAMVFGSRLDVQGEVFAEVARVYAHMGDLPRAEQLAHRALQLRAELHGPRSLAVSESLDQLGDLHAMQGMSDSAIADYRRAVEIRAEALSAPDSLLAHRRLELARLFREAGRQESAAVRGRAGNGSH